MNQVIKCDKSFQERLEEYLGLFAGLSSVLEIKKELSAYLELALDPSGWQAIWRIPRSTCESLKIPFPTIVLAYVENVVFTKQVAQVKVIAAQQHIDLPEAHIVPLTQLFATKEQDKTVCLNLESTANALDVLNFFYTNLYMPWDDEDDSDWVENHLQERLRLFYDTNNGVIPQDMAKYFKSLLIEAKRLYIKVEAFQKSLKGLGVETEQADDTALADFMEVRVRMMEIQKEVEKLENPLLRSALIKQHKTLEKEENEKSEPNFWIVFKEPTVVDCVSFLEQVKALCPKETFKTASTDLTVALEDACSGDVIVLSKGKHKTESCGSLETGGTLKGVFGKTDTIIASTNENIMFDISGCVLIENVLIEAEKSQCAILVRSGKVTLRNCLIVGDTFSSVHQGFIVLGGGSLELIDCAVAGFGMGIVGNSKSNITLRNCEIYNIGYGLKIHDKCAVDMQNCIFRDCREYAVWIETERDVYGGDSVGDFFLLKSFPDIMIKSTKAMNNGKGNVIITETLRIQPLSDVFSQPAVLNKTDWSILGEDFEESDSEEDSADLNNTVIEIDSD